MLEKYIFNLPKYFKNMDKFAFVSKSLKVKYALVSYFVVLTLSYNFMTYAKHPFPKIHRIQ